MPFFRQLKRIGIRSLSELYDTYARVYPGRRDECLALDGRPIWLPKLTLAWYWAWISARDQKSFVDKGAKSERLLNRTCDVPLAWCKGLHLGLSRL